MTRAGAAGLRRKPRSVVLQEVDCGPHSQPGSPEPCEANASIKARATHLLKGLPAASERPVEFVVLGWLVAIATMFGLVMVLSASSVASVMLRGSPWSIFEHQVIWVILGFTSLSVSMRVDYRRWRRIGTLSLALCIVALVGVLVPGLGIGRGGASRWIGIGPLRVQPSEIVKLAMLFFVAEVLTRRAAMMEDWHQTLVPPLAAFGIVGVLLMAQPDMGTTMVVAGLVISLLWAAGTPVRRMAVLCSAGIVGVFLMGWVAPYRRARLLSFIDPWGHRLTSGFQVVESLVGLAGGHMLGVGLGSSPLKWGLLPNPYTDFIFAVVGSDLGIIGTFSVVAIFGAIGWFGLKVAANAPDRFGLLLATGITTWLVGQATINMGAVVGLLPVTGIPLPFVSFGGSSLVIDLVATGILLNIAGRSGKAKQRRML